MLMRRGRSQRPKEDTATTLDRQLLLTLINNLSDGVLALDSNRQVLIANGAALSLLDKNELKGRALNDSLFLIDKPGNPVDLETLIPSSPEGYSSRELRLKFRNGATVNLFIHIVPVRLSFGSEGGGFVIIMRDITAEKLVEEERDDFINVAGHELRTPVAVVEASLSNALLMAQRSQLSDTIIQSLKTAHDQTTFLSSMINDLAVLSRADRGKLAMNIETFKIDELVSELSSAYTPQAQNKNLTLGFSQSPEAEELCSSRLYVSEVLQNLITNSLKYTLSGGLQISVLAAAGGIQFRVTDTGIGISPRDQEKLFEKFFRSGDDRVKSQHGTGLGLYITRKLAELLMANIEVQSELNTGTTFVVTFPNLTSPQKPVASSDPDQPQPLANNT